MKKTAHVLILSLVSLPMAQAAQLDRAIPRGNQIVEFGVPSGGPDEICVVPKHLDFADYEGKDGKKDIKDEEELCKLDFYKTEGTTKDNGTVGVCPKINSTSAATELMSVTPEFSKSAVQNSSNCSKRDRSTKKAAKFKQTDNDRTCTHTASILGYYHVSRVLGGAGEVEPAVIRSMSIEQHKKVVSMALTFQLTSLIKQSWKNFVTAYANPQGSEGKNFIFTTDYQQIYGALIKNAKGESAYKDWDKDADSFSSVPAFKNTVKSTPATEMLGTTFSQDTVQKIVSMRDMSDMLLLDYLFSQGDRFSGGNFSYVDYVYYQDGGKVKKEKASKVESGESPVPAGTVTLKIKKNKVIDTDCGLINGTASNKVMKKGWLEQISHMHPSAYQGLQTLATRWATDASIKDYFRTELMFGNSDMKFFETTLLKAAQITKDRCKAGKLFLDLDLDNFFSGSPMTKEQLKALCG